MEDKSKMEWPDLVEIQKQVKTLVPSPTVRSVLELSARLEEQSIREGLIRLGWTPPEGDRKTVLLKATYDLLRQCRESDYVQNIFELTTPYDGTECDGLCLMDDIRSILEIDEEADQ